MDLPYKNYQVGYGLRISRCRFCRHAGTNRDPNIRRGELRLAPLVWDNNRVIPCWYHFECFFNETDMCPNENDIEDFADLRPEDQQRVRNEIALRNPPMFILGLFRIERRRIDNLDNVKCRRCDDVIAMNEIRIAKKTFETDAGKKLAGEYLWYHPRCFVEVRRDLGYYLCGDNLPGFQDLTLIEQQEIIQHLPMIQEEVEN